MPQPKAYTVSQITDYIKNIFDSDYLLPRLTVSGEIWECKYHSAGHIYFTIKDDAAVLNCVMFAKNRAGLSHELKLGQKIDVSGSISIYKASGKYQLYANSIKLSGQGDLFARFLALKEALAQTGLFDPVYKKPVPQFINTLGIVTSADSAALQDMLRIAHRRNPCVEIIISPAAVQGEGAAASLIKALKALDCNSIDVIIIGRGGGSAEDLWAFNDEALAQAIFDCETPVISAVGHETDFTIADFVADLRAPTPSAAAELAIFEHIALVNTLNIFKNNLNASIINKMTRTASYIEKRRLLLETLNPVSQLALTKERLARYRVALNNDIQSSMMGTKYKLGRFSERLNGISPLNTLSRGYAFVTNKENNAVKSSKDVTIGEKIFIKLAAGELSAAVETRKP